MAIRTQRQVPNLYFGKPGKPLLALPWPKGGLDKTYERQTYDFVTGSGMHQVSSLVNGSRPYTINWDALYLDTFAKLDQYRIGANGPGPFVLIDPSAPNLLPSNVAASCGLYADATDWITLGGTSGYVSSNSTATFIHRAQGHRSLRWLFSDGSVLAQPILRVGSLYRNWFGIPVVPTLSYAFSSWMRVDGTIETNALVAMKISWLDAAGSQISLSTGGDISVTSTWSRQSCIAAAPAGAVYAAPRWVLDGTTMAVGGSLYVDEPIFEQDIVVNDWAPSTGLRPVEILELGEGVPFESRFRVGTTMTVRELSR